MNKCIKLFLLALIVFTTFFAYGVKALELKINNPLEVEKHFAPNDKCSDILGDVNDPDSTAWLLQHLLNYIKILGPTIAIVLGSIDFSKAIINSDEENMKKAKSKFIKRLVAAVALFLVPTAAQILLGLFGITSDNATCGLH